MICFIPLKCQWLNNNCEQIRMELSSHHYQSPRLSTGFLTGWATWRHQCLALLVRHNNNIRAQFPWLCVSISAWSSEAGSEYAGCCQLPFNSRCNFKGLVPKPPTSLPASLLTFSSLPPAAIKETKTLPEGIQRAGLQKQSVVSRGWEVQEWGSQGISSPWHYFNEQKKIFKVTQERRKITFWDLIYHQQWS